MLVPLTISRSESNFSNALVASDSNDHIHNNNNNNNMNNGNWMPLYGDMTGLSNDGAKKAFLEELQPVLESHSFNVNYNENGWISALKRVRWDYISFSSIAATIGCVIAFIVMGVTTLLYNKKGIPLVVPMAILESILLLIFLTIDTFVRLREDYFMRSSLLDRIKTVLTEFEKYGIQNVQASSNVHIYVIFPIISMCM